MSSQPRSNGGERMIHQDYIARIRYSNALPPPPNPPKLLDIPNTGLASGQYTTPGFASRLAREQPLNVEADAELGMPLDLVGMPGIFDGDESSIQPPAQTPPVHPHDRALLRPLSTLGKPKVADTSVSFLRRTEYISAYQVKPRQDGLFLKSGASASAAAAAAAGNKQRAEKRKASPEPDKGTPAWIKRRIERSFDAAARHLADRSRVRHPTKRNVKPVDAFPLLPDLEAFPDSGAYVTVKFVTNPISSAGDSDVYDTRLLSGVFKPIERSAVEEKAYEDALAAWERDPRSAPKPTNMMNYDFFLARDADTGSRFRARFDVDNPHRDDPTLYTSPDAGGSFRFPRVRAYETAQERELDHDSKYEEEVILAFRHAARQQGSEKEKEKEKEKERDDAAQRAVYYYPVMQRSTIRSQRDKNIARTTGFAAVVAADDEEKHYDELHVRVDEPSDELRAELRRFKNQPVGFLDDEEEEDEEEDEGRGREQGGRNGGSGSGENEDGGGDGEGEGRARRRERQHEVEYGGEDDDVVEEEDVAETNGDAAAPRSSATLNDDDGDEEEEEDGDAEPIAVSDEDAEGDEE